MNDKPFPLKVWRAVPEKQAEMYCRDVRTEDDPLPAVVDITAGGYALAKRTMTTDVRAETTDDK